MIRRLRALFLIVIGLFSASGCARYSMTRVFLHGKVTNEDGLSIPFAVVRVGKFETLTSLEGHYRVLYLASCLRGGVGVQGVQTPEVEAFASGYKKTTVGFHLDTIEAVGGGSCPADSDKFLALVLAK